MESKILVLQNVVIVLRYSLWTIATLLFILLLISFVKVDRYCHICNKKCFEELLITNFTGAGDINYEHAECSGHWGWKFPMKWPTARKVTK